MTNEQLSALPEFPDYEIEILANGTTVRHRRSPKFIAYASSPDDIALFSDRDGTWTVIYNLEGGPYKRRVF